MSATAKLEYVAASLPCRVIVVAWAVGLFWLFGLNLLVRVLNPFSLSWFLIHAYGIAAGVMAFVFFFTKRLSHLAFIVPAAIYFTIVIFEVVL